MEKCNLNITTEKGESVELVTVLAEPHPQDEDKVAGWIQTVQNKCCAIGSILESIQIDLNIIADAHIDGNAKEIALILAKKFKRIEEGFYLATQETEGDDWEDYALLEILGHCAKSGQQTLVVPSLRAGFKCVVTDEFGESFDESEFQKHLAHIRRQFNFCGDFK